MPEVGDNIRVASDVGMYAQTFLLALTAHGFGGIPQTMLGFFADTVRGELGIGPGMKLLFGISFEHPDLEAQENSTRLGRDPIDENVTFHRCLTDWCCFGWENPIAIHAPSDVDEDRQEPWKSESMAIARDIQIDFHVFVG